MFTPEQIKALYLDVMDRMLRAGWLHSHRFTDGKGHHLVWTALGASIAITLRRLIHGYGLLDDDRGAMTFDILAHGDRLADPELAANLDETLALFWRKTVEELGIHGDEDRLLVMVHIVDGWAPGLDTRITPQPE